MPPTRSWISWAFPSRTSTSSPWQFSLRSLFIVILVVAVLLLVIKAQSLFYLFMMLLTMLLLPGFVAGIVYGKGADRAFCIGGATATLIGSVFLAGGRAFHLGMPLDLLVWPLVWGWIVASGVVSVWVRHFMLKRRKMGDSG
jgi:hypothetical protein